MIGFQVNGEFLDLTENGQIEFNRNTPLSQQDGFIIDDYTLPFTFPNTPKNMRILGWPHIVENADRNPAKWDCVMYFNGVPRRNGELRAQKPINRNVISLTFYSGVSVIGEAFRNVSLREILTQEFVIHELEIFKSLIINFIPVASDRCAIRINGVNFSGTDMNDLVANINADTELTVTASNNSNELTLTSDLEGEFEPFFVVVPDDVVFINLVGIPAWMNTYRNAYIDFVEDTKINRPTKALRFGTFANFDKFTDEEFPLKSAPIVNYADQDGFATNIFTISDPILQNPTVVNRNSMAPMLTLSYVLSQIEAYFDITIDFEQLNEDDVLFHPFTLDRPIDFFGSRKLILFERSINASQLVPDIRANDLIKAIQIAFNASVEYNARTRTLKIANKEPIVTARQYTDITERCELPSHIELSTKKGLTFKFQDDADSIETLSVAPSDFVIGEGEKPITVGFSVPGNVTHPQFSYWPSNAPATTVAVRLPFSNDFPLRFSRYTDLGALDSTNWFWQGLNGLIETYWKNSIPLEDSPIIIENKWQMTTEEVFNMPWGTRWRIDRSDYLLQSFNLSLENQNISQSDCVFLKLPFFGTGTLPTENAIWQGLAGSLICVKDGSQQNTGQAFFQLLEEVDADTLVPTGRTKTNNALDPDYIAPAENLVACPIPAEQTAGNLYISVSPAVTHNEPKIFLNGQEFLMRSGQPNSFPYPWPIPAGPNTMNVLCHALNGATSTWRVRHYHGSTLVFDQSILIESGNLVRVGPLQIADFSDEARTITLSDILANIFDPAFINRTVITIQYL